MLTVFVTVQSHKPVLHYNMTLLPSVMYLHLSFYLLTPFMLPISCARDASFHINV